MAETAEVQYHLPGENSWEQDAGPMLLSVKLDSLAGELVRGWHHAVQDDSNDGL